MDWSVLLGSGITLVTACVTIWFQSRASRRETKSQRLGMAYERAGGQALMLHMRATELDRFRTEVQDLAHGTPKSTTGSVTEQQLFETDQRYRGRAANAVERLLVAVVKVKSLESDESRVQKLSGLLTAVLKELNQRKEESRSSDPMPEKGALSDFINFCTDQASRIR